MDFAAVAELCAPGVAVGTLERIARVESNLNPFAIGVVGARLERQPRTLSEAIATADALKSRGYDYSLGLVQVNQKNFGAYGLSHETAFDPCHNLQAGSLIFQDCYRRAGVSSHQLGDALSCYYSGNFKTGYALGYVARYQTLPIAPDAIPIIARRRVRAPRDRKVFDTRTEPLPQQLFVTESAPGDARTSPSTALLF